MPAPLPALFTNRARGTHENPIREFGLWVVWEIAAAFADTGKELRRLGRRHLRRARLALRPLAHAADLAYRYRTQAGAGACLFALVHLAWLAALR